MPSASVSEKHGEIKAIKIANRLIRLDDKIPRTDYIVGKIETDDDDVLIYDKENKVIMMFHEEPYLLYFYPLPKSSGVGFKS